MTQHLWYLQRQDTVVGPFPEGQLREMFGARQLDLRDLVSLDRQHWVKLIETDILTAKPHHEPIADQAWFEEREKAKRRWMDDSPEMEEVAVGAEGEAVEHLREIEQETRSLLDARTKKLPALVGGLGMVLILLLIGIGVWKGQSQDIKISADTHPRIRNCSQPAGEGVVWTDCVMNEANLAYANLRNADLKGIHLERANLKGADLSYADLEKADLRGANLSGVELKGANLSRADLTGADLSHADLGFAVMAGARVEGVRFDNAVLKQTTWIDGRECSDASVGVCQ